MKHHSHLTDSVESIFEAFFLTGAQHNKLHTLKIAEPEHINDESEIATIVAAVEGVEGVKVNAEQAQVHVVYDGSPEPISDALDQAGFKNDALH